MKKKVSLILVSVFFVIICAFNFAACSYTKSLVFHVIQEGDYPYAEEYSYLAGQPGEIAVVDIKDRNITKLVIPSKYKGKPVTTIGGVFSGLNQLITISFPNTLRVIESFAFSYCTKLTNIELPDSLQGIGDEVFKDDSELTRITIGKNLKIILPYAFQNCEKLEDVYYNGTQEEWNKIRIMKGNECLLNANIHFAD